MKQTNTTDAPMTVEINGKPLVLAPAYLGPIAAGQLYRHNRSGKLYRVLVVEQPQVSQYEGSLSFSYRLTPSIGYMGQRNGQRFGPWRSAKPAAFAAAFTLVPEVK